MASMESQAIRLPHEIMAMIIEYVDIKTSKALRLAHRSWGDVAAAPVFRHIMIPHKVRQVDSGDSGFVSVVDERPERIREQAKGICQHEDLRKCVKHLTWKPNVRALPQTTLEFAREDGTSVGKPYNLVMYRFMKEIMQIYLRNCPNLSKVDILHYLSRVEDHVAFDELRPTNELLFLPLFGAYSHQLKELRGRTLAEGDLTITRQYSAVESARMSKWESLEKLVLWFRTPDEAAAYEARRVVWTLQHLPNLSHLDLSFQAGPSNLRAGAGTYVRIWDVADWASLYLPHLKSLTLAGVSIATGPLRHLLFTTSDKLQSVGLDDLWLRDAEWSEIFDDLDQLGVRAARIATVGYRGGDYQRPHFPDPVTVQDQSSWYKLWQNTNHRRDRLGLQPLDDTKAGNTPPDISKRTTWWLRDVPDW